MVKLCNTTFKLDNIDDIKRQHCEEQFSNFPFELDHFQKYAVVGIETGKHVLITAHTGSGKCLKFDTPVMMYDGSIKPVQDIKVCDKLMGDDSTARNVKGLARGIEHMYNIILSDGSSFGCNESHILSLKYNRKPYIKNNKEMYKLEVNWFDNNELRLRSKSFNYKDKSFDDCEKEATLFLNNITRLQQSYFNISVKDYLKLPKSVKCNTLSYKVGLDFEEKHIRIDPYILGVWLGEEDSNSDSFTNQDPVILKDILERYNLINNKHIPDDFKFNSRENRMKLLAGLIDSDGNYCKKKYEITQKNKVLASDIKYLVQSLGFSCKMTEVIKECKYYEVTFSGKNIPILCNRKKCKEPGLINNSSLEYFFKVESEGIGNYYGFELDGNRKFVLGNFIVTHNTMPSEHAIQKFCSSGKKVIYTGPIKSLSNQKYHEFTQKYPDISFGIMTGDIKFNPEADCIIMTTEILRNVLYNSKASLADDVLDQENSLEFNLDIENDVACVIFDEVHYINDLDRGKVWEECIMNMPNQIQMVMLSATIDREYQFARWIETIKQREVWIASTHKRTVPLKHYMYYLTNARFHKNISQSIKSNTKTDLKILKKINTELTDKFLDFQDTDNYSNLYKLNAYIEKNGLRVSKQDVLNRIVKKLHSADMLPAICFVFSRKQVEHYAKFIETNLFEVYDKETGDLNRTEHKKSNMVEKECKQILMKFPNYNEYINLPEYHAIISLLQKGVAIHHSGILPVLREMIELMFDKGYVKLLFATETFAVGVNMPTKTVLFTSLSKYSNSGFRYLLPHEYTQMAGRAGRRGLDTIGHVIHLNNLFELPDTHSYKQILSGNPQTLSSKFKVEPQLILKLFKVENEMETDVEIDVVNYKDNKKDSIIKYLETSMNYEQKSGQLGIMINEVITLQNDIDTKYKAIKIHKFDIDIIKKYVEKTNLLQYMKSKKRKSAERELNQIRENAPRNFETLIKTYEEIEKLENELRVKQDAIYNIKEYSVMEYEKMYNILHAHDFIKEHKLTKLGKIASTINELNSIVIGTIIDKNLLQDFDVYDFICYISLFTQVRISDEFKRNYFDTFFIKVSNRDSLKYAVKQTEETMSYYFNLMLRNEINCNQDDYTLYYDVYSLVNEWCYAENETEAKCVIQKCNGRGIFMGEFVKCLLKIVNISNEINSVAIKIADIKLQYITSQVEEKLLKFVATNQSLYV